MWKYISEIASFKCPWVELIGEKWEDNNFRAVEYWRTVTVDSVIVIPIQSGDLLLPRKIFRPGVNKETLDFPGGRMENEVQIDQVVNNILIRELGVDTSLIGSLINLYDKPMLVNSSSTNQKLFGFYVNINKSVKNKLLPHFRFRMDECGINNLLKELECLQCRALLLEFLRIRKLQM